MWHKLNWMVLAAAVVVSASGVAQAADILYYDSFSRTGDLNGSTPDITWNSNSWVAGDGTTDGSVCSVPYSNFFACLSFVPTGNDIYTLSVDATPQNGNTDNWLSLDFLNDLDQTKARQGPWILLRDNGNLQAFGGPAIDNLVYDGPGGNPGQFNNLQVVLDTTHSAWTSTFYINGTQVCSMFTYASNPTIVGVCIANYDVPGSFDNFSLMVPEPASLIMLTAGGLCLLAYTWRRRK